MRVRDRWSGRNGDRSVECGYADRAGSRLTGGCLPRCGQANRTLARVRMDGAEELTEQEKEATDDCDAPTVLPSELQAAHNHSRTFSDPVRP